MGLSNEEILEIVYPYTKNKPNMVLSLGLITPLETRKCVFGQDGNLLCENQWTYEIGSITKSVVASLVIDLVEQGKISLADKVFREITLEQLLTHSSGIGEYPIREAGDHNPFS